MIKIGYILGISYHLQFQLDQRSKLVEIFINTKQYVHYTMFEPLKKLYIIGYKPQADEINNYWLAHAHGFYLFNPRFLNFFLVFNKTFLRTWSLEEKNALIIIFQQYFICNICLIYLSIVAQNKENFSLLIICDMGYFKF